MKSGIFLPVSMLLLIDSGVVPAQDQAAKPKEFEAGKPLGAVNEKGEFTPITNNVKVYGSFRFAESCTYDSTRNLIVVMNAGVSQEQEKITATCRCSIPMGPFTRPNGSAPRATD